MAKLEKDEKWLTYRNGQLEGEELYKYIFCINIDDNEASSSQNND